MRAQLEHIARLATTSRATVGIIPLERFPVLAAVHGWDQHDQIISIETTAGDFEIADPIEVAQYERWANLLTESAATGNNAASLAGKIAARRED